MKIVLCIAREYYDLVFGSEVDQTDGTIGHVRILQLVLLMAHMLQIIQIAPQGELPRLLSGLEKALFDVSDSAKDVPAAIIRLYDLPDLIQ